MSIAKELSSTFHLAKVGSRVPRDRGRAGRASLPVSLWVIAAAALAATAALIASAAAMARVEKSKG